MKVSSTLEAFQERIGYRFQAPQLLINALTHSSWVAPKSSNNERLEFLGDRVLGLVMAEALLECDPSAREGELAPRFNAMVRKETCADVARAAGLGEVLRLGRSEMISGGRRKNALLGDAMEAVIAAVYLDGGFEAAKAVVKHLWGDRITSVDSDSRDPKTLLQEWAQAHLGETPTYSVIAREGPDHEPTFTIEARLTNGLAATAKAKSKRMAEQAAAETLLKQQGLKD